MNMVKLYQSLGQKDKVDEYLGKLQKQEAEESKPPQHITIDGDNDDDDTGRGDIDSPTLKTGDEDSTSRQV